MDLDYIFLCYSVCMRVLVLHAPDACWPSLGSLFCMVVDFGVQEGTGITKLIPHLSPEGQDLLQKLLMYNPEDRISAKQALRHAFFREIRSELTCHHPRLPPHYYPPDTVSTC
jgi:serine/threonine protein kinase